MWNDDRPKPKTTEFPRNLGTLSVRELEEYIGELTSEIQRVQGDIDQKRASQAAAASFFKS